MTVYRTAIGLLLGLGLAQAGTARAEDPAVRTQPLDTTIIEDVVDGIGGILGVLVGPPVSSPTPYLEGRIPSEPLQKEEVAAPSPAPASVPVAVSPPISAPPVAIPVAVTPAAPAPSRAAPPDAVPAPVVKSVAPPRPAPPPPRPAVPAVAAPVAPAAIPAPVCSVRVAATATLEQMRRLPRCP